MAFTCPSGSGLWPFPLVFPEGPRLTSLSGAIAAFNNLGNCLVIKVIYCLKHSLRRRYTSPAVDTGRKIFSQLFPLLSLSLLLHQMPWSPQTMKGTIQFRSPGEKMSSKSAIFNRIYSLARTSPSLCAGGSFLHPLSFSNPLISHFPFPEFNSPLFLSFRRRSLWNEKLPSE